MLEFDSRDGFKCQRCSDWTRGGSLYSSPEGKRICFLCHIDDVSRDMLKLSNPIEENESNISTGIHDTRSEQHIDILKKAINKGLSDLRY